MNERARERMSYIAGFVLAAILTVLAFVAVTSGRLESGEAMLAVAVAGIAQLLVHLRFFLHLDLSQQKREDLQLILFSSLLLAIMVGGTIWIMGNLSAHMS